MSEGERAAEKAKFEIGAPPQLAAKPIPWGYGEDRITALVRSPDTLYVYWEVRDEAIAAARARLGPAGTYAWLDLRVYDTTGRDFDGTNANHYFDVGVSRTDRDYFFNIHRPTSVVHVEIGLMSHEGFFQPIARSGGAEFPRKAPSSNTWAEWMTVDGGGYSPAARPYESRYRGPPPRIPGSAAQVPAPPPPPPAPNAPVVAAPRRWTVEEQWSALYPLEVGRSLEELPWLLEHWRTEWREGMWFFRMGEGRVDEVFEWHEGPFPMPFIDAGRVEVQESGGGPRVVSTDGGPLTVHGPWSVTIRSFDARPERRVLARWTLRGVAVSPPVAQRWITAFERRRRTVGTDRWVFFLGASGAFELREIGASEAFWLGASERLWIGASGWMLGGASEALLLGASQLAFAGASGLLQQGASERAGSSEHFAGSTGYWG